jgi:hypothetical protein
MKTTVLLLAMIALCAGCGGGGGNGAAWDTTDEPGTPPH